MFLRRSHTLHLHISLSCLIFAPEHALYFLPVLLVLKHRSWTPNLKLFWLMKRVKQKVICSPFVCTCRGYSILPLGTSTFLNRKPPSASSSFFASLPFSPIEWAGVSMTWHSEKCSSRWMRGLFRSVDRCVSHGMKRFGDSINTPGESHLLQFLYLLLEPSESSTQNLWSWSLTTPASAST